MYEGMSLLMIANAKAIELAEAVVKKALSRVDDMCSFHKILMFDDIDNVARRISSVNGVECESVRRMFIDCVMTGTMDGLRKMGYRDIEGHRAMDGSVPIGYAIEFNEPFSYTV